MSKLTEEIKRLSRKIDNIDQRVEKIEKKQPKITVKVSTGWDSSVSISNPKFKVGDKFIPHKPKDEWNRYGFMSSLDKYDGKILTITEITRMGNLRVDVDDDDFYFNPSWCTKVEEPKFKKGDWVRSLITGTVGKVEAFYEEGNNSRYLLSTIDGEKFTPKANNLEPYFPKEGEYCYCELNWADKWLFISSKKKGILSHMTAFCPKDYFIDYNNQITDDENIKDLRPATSEEKALLDSELAKRGLIFDGKEIVKDNTPKVGDFCIFWGEIPEKAFCDILYEIHNSIYPFRRDNFWYKNCIKYESMEQFRKIKEGKI